MSALTFDDSAYANLQDVLRAAGCEHVYETLQDECVTYEHVSQEALCGRGALLNYLRLCGLNMANASDIAHVLFRAQRSDAAGAPSS